MGEALEHAEYYERWAADIRKMNGTSVDADHADETARILRALHSALDREEHLHTRTINARDLFEDFLGDTYAEATGKQPEWSNLFGAEDAFNEIAAAFSTLRTTLSRKTELLGLAAKDQAKLHHALKMTNDTLAIAVKTVIELGDIEDPESLYRPIENNKRILAETSPTLDALRDELKGDAG